MTHLAGGLLAVAAVLVCIARRTAGKPPLWRSKLALVGALLCLISGSVLVALDPTAIGETPVVIVAALCLFEGGMALISLMAAAGARQPRWLG
ncbi:MAG: hypothetical protein KA085_06960 [Phenylobacterium sp.]|uniref:hypothetical protein n=1 Tax=Phenylobacterium sp. TaxID=1871053 RepID=UPI001B53BD12|nr:hypothetical protein [Phenylobacterium sp.]MBP7651556.1 hypothetical protein [Phenylobacterium sp.]MBP7815848.1 hypothetical protein [Phenylobacterium sp.]MBP9755670.1 hypothetical protein [Phenylobacterium sp.]